jgi:hypothetical protein
MGCGFFVDWIACGPIKLLAWILPGEGIVTNIIALFITVFFTYVFIRASGKIGGILLMVVGIAGAAFTAGVSIALTVIGFIATMMGKKAGLIAGLTFIMGIICIICSMLSA